MAKYPRLKSTVLTTIGSQPVGNYDLASVYAGIREKEFALKCLEKGMEQHESMMVFLKQWAKLIPWYKNDPRIIALEKKIGLG